ncbi:MAG: metallophosphoesterase [Candidatus Sumerlaeia bacterium]|nr:metallophosphoesterase [Candidatus Sumerlaeia bacterium]
MSVSSNADGAFASSPYLRSRWRAATSQLVTRVHVHLAGRHTLRAQGTRLLKGIGAGVGYAALIEPRWIERTHIEFAIPGLPVGLDGYRIVHLSDLHHNLIAGRGFLQRVVELANGLDPDLVVVTGDFVTHNPERLWGCFDILRHLRAPDGVLATRGNHDYRCSLDMMERACDRAGVRLLENRHVVVRPTRQRGLLLTPRREPTGLVVAGVGDLQEGLVDPARALGTAPADLPRILLSHNPLVAELIRPEHQVALQLSGHTHGGQVRPFRRPIALFNGGAAQYSSGIVAAPHTTVYVSRGVGTSALHVRWNCRPEIALLTLHPAPESAPAPVSGRDSRPPAVP